MTFLDYLKIAGSVLFSVTGGAALVFALSKWIGGVWAAKIIENEKAKLTREQELLVRRRNVYAKLAVAMRVFLQSTNPATEIAKQAFLSVYDEAALWASEEVAKSLGQFLDTHICSTRSPGSVDPETLQGQFVACITEMRRDCGFPSTQYRHRVVSF